MSQLIKGVAYHGNRMLHHVREDMRILARDGFNTVLHTYSHVDLDRYNNIMRDIFAITQDYGLDVWADNWGLAGPPGDKSHFLSYHPEAHQVGSDGLVSPVRVCYNAPSFVEFTKGWVDAVYNAGARKVFWDEPHYADENTPNGRVWTCRCETCQKLFEEKYGKPMPTIITPEVDEFRKWSISNYFSIVAGYAKAKGMYNVVCVMFSDSQDASNFGVDLDSICSSEMLDNIGSDPYWCGNGPKGYTEVYKFVYERTRHNLELCEKYGKDHNLWLQTFAHSAAQMDEAIAAGDAIVDAGATTMFAWGYMGSDAADYRVEAPDGMWYYTRMAFDRMTSRHFDNERKRVRESLGLE